MMVCERGSLRNRPRGKGVGRIREGYAKLRLCLP